MRARFPTLTGLLAVLVIVGGTSVAEAQLFGTSPGALSGSHASLDGESNCGVCHTSGKALSRDKCLGCHDHSNMRARIESGTGFHSSDKPRGKDCWLCHTEHKGKGFDPMGWATIGGRANFNHDWTGWPLQGKHQQVGCDDCHKRRNRTQGIKIYLNEPKLCGACHRDPHNFDRTEMKKCDRCHTQDAWRPQKKPLAFDHNNPSDAKFPLRGSHVDVACAKCHEKAVFNLKNDFSDCKSCHEKDSPHKGMLFDNRGCDQCHSDAEPWKKFSFDHNRRTKFRLDGGHTGLNCYSCHKKTVDTKPNRACESCHQTPHRERFDKYGDCSTCHGTRDFKTDQTKFEHAKRTTFPLTAKHAIVPCRACHRGKEPFDFEKFPPGPGLKRDCMGCHQHENVHNKQFKSEECLRCHLKPGDKRFTDAAANKFHGPGSDFPLTDAHAKLKCEQCHKQEDRFDDVSPNCGEKCHVDRLHKGSLGSECTKCHEGGVWDPTRFDHNRDSTYKLIGLHKKVDCFACHPQRQFKPTPNACVACHAEDDAHGGALGKRCETCHKETGQNIFEHNRDSTFKLVGAHVKTECASCHATMAFKPVQTTCVGCHPDPDVHKGRYGTRCEGCHDAVSFNRIRPIHDVGDFSLAGAHDQLPCARCHQDKRPLAGTGNLCATCHRSEDIHSNSLGPNCGKCHSQWSFAPARFQHNQVGCDLKGVHRTLPCLDCHKAGNYMAVSPACVSCHLNDALAVPIARFNHNGLTECANCHNPNFFYPANRPSGRESICR